MNTKHTPGPWYPKNTAGDHQGLVIAENTGATVAVTYSVNDAALVAAAPELLCELKSAIFYIETYGGEVTASFAAGGNMARIKAVITKATQ
jgi:hypothetical protein